MKNKPKKVLYIGGGAMAGVWSAGVCHSLLLDPNIFQKISAVYASSSGAMVASYFLANQCEVGPTIFYDDLIHNFIIPRHVPLTFFDLFVNKFIHPVAAEKMRNTLDINYVFNVVNGSKKLGVESIQKRGIPFYVHVFDTNSLRSDFINITENKEPFQVLKSAVSAVPYFCPSNLRYVDGEIDSAFPISMIKVRQPDEKVIAVLNMLPKKLAGGFLKRFLEGGVASFVYGFRIWIFYTRRNFHTMRAIRQSKKDPMVKIIFAPSKLDLWPNTVNRDKLLRAFEDGKMAGKELLKEFS